MHLEGNCRWVPLKWGWLTSYPLDSALGFPITYQPSSDISGSYDAII